MTAVLALLPGLISLIPSITTGVSSLMAFISSIRTAAQQSGEWTPELEASFIAALIARAGSGAWQTDAQITAAKVA